MDKNILRSYIPENSIEPICDILSSFRLKVKIVNPRKRIHGSYRRPKSSMEQHIITINRDLNPYTFLITFLHEIAHMYAWEQYKSMKHGKEWKLCFTWLIKQILPLNVFPEDVRYALEKHLQKIKSSEFMDVELSKTLQKYDQHLLANHDELIHLEDTPRDAVFLYGNKKMKKQSLMRKYYLCRDLNTNKLYRCHPLMKVSLVEVK
jgi:hypothetical protein